jgi:transcription initiation factor IIE alpha subunit
MAEGLSFAQQAARNHEAKERAAAAAAAAAQSSAANLNQPRTLTDIDMHARKLIKMVIRCYYSTKFKREWEVVMDALLDLDVLNDRRIREDLLAEKVQLPAKKIRAIMQKLRDDGLVFGAPFVEEKEPAEGKKKRAQITKAMRKFAYTVDYEHFVRVLKYRHEQMFSKLNKPVDKSDQTYVCVNPQCSLKGKRHTVLDLLMSRTIDPSAGASKDDQFRCPAISCKITQQGREVGRRLVLSSESRDQLGGGLDDLKARFNREVGPIFSQLNRLDQLLKEERAHQIEQTRRIAAGEIAAPTKPTPASFSSASSTSASSAIFSSVPAVSVADAVSMRHQHNAAVAAKQVAMLPIAEQKAAAAQMAAQAAAQAQVANALLQKDHERFGMENNIIVDIEESFGAKPTFMSSTPKPTATATTAKASAAVTGKKRKRDDKESTTATNGVKKEKPESKTKRIKREREEKRAAELTAVAEKVKEDLPWLAQVMPQQKIAVEQEKQKLALRTQQKQLQAQSQQEQEERKQREIEEAYRMELARMISEAEAAAFAPAGSTGSTGAPTAYDIPALEGADGVRVGGDEERIPHQQQHAHNGAHANTNMAVDQTHASAADEPTFNVHGRMVPLSQLQDGDQQDMTEAEFDRYTAIVEAGRS